MGKDVSSASFVRVLIYSESVALGEQCLVNCPIIVYILSIFKSVTMAPFDVPTGASLPHPTTTEAASAPAQVAALKAEGAIAQIRTAIQRYRTSRDTLRDSPSSSFHGLDESQVVQSTPGLKTDAETLDEIEEVLRNLETSAIFDLSLDENDQVDLPEVSYSSECSKSLQLTAFQSTETDNWQLQTRLPASVRTHPQDFEPFGHHLKDLKTFKNDLISATKLSRETKPLYKKVEVFLITWEENDDIKEEVEGEVDALTKLFGELNYHVTPFAIPNIDSQNELQFEVLNFLRAHKKDPPGETLLIVYYTGHGSIRDNACYWHPTAGAASGINRRDPSSRQTGPTVEWSKIQENFEHVNKQDVLFILDCCYAGSAAMHKGSGQSTKELLAACGSEEETEAGDGSFTLRLVGCMRRMVQTEKVFQVSWLYEALITVSQSPLCLHVNLNKSPLSIWLSSLATSNPTDLVEEYRQAQLAPQSPSGHLAPSSRESNQAASIFSGEQDISDQATQLSSIVPDVPFDWHYRVLLSIKLRNNILPTAQSWALEFPAGQVEGLEDVTFELLCPTKSTLLFVTMPVRQWLLLRDNPAYTFIDFVEKGNMLHSPVKDLQTSSKEISSINRTDSDKSTSTKDLADGDIVNYLLATMRDFFQKTQDEESQQKKAGKITRTFQIIASNFGIPSRLEADPRFGLVKAIVQSLDYKSDDQGEFESLRYGLRFDVLVEKIFESSRKSVKDAIHKATTKDKIESTITTEFDQLEKSVVNLSEKIFLEPKTVAQAHMRTKSNVGFKQPKFEAVPEDAEVMGTPVIGVGRTDTDMSKKAPKRTESMKDPTRTDSKPLTGFWSRRLSKDSAKMRADSRIESPLHSPRSTI
jgi:hypothetical protein